LAKKNISGKKHATLHKQTNINVPDLHLLASELPIYFPDVAKQKTVALFCQLLTVNIDL
jgi:hypothetical protein